MLEIAGQKLTDEEYSLVYQFMTLIDDYDTQIEELKAMRKKRVKMLMSVTGGMYEGY